MIDRDIIDKFSNRTEEIKKVAAEKNITSARQAEKLGARTRQNKNKSATEAEVKQNWNDRLSQTQVFNINASAGSVQPGMAVKKARMAERGLTPGQAVELALKHHLQNKSSVSEKHVLAEALNRGNFSLDEVQEAYNQREDILGSMKDSIQAKRELTAEEEKMLSDLTDQYYDYHYNEYAEVSEQGRQLMTIWNRKISPHRQHYETYLDELARLEQKFYKQHLKKYGQSFCHLLFKYGVICYPNNEIGTIEFGEII